MQHKEPQQQQQQRGSAHSSTCCNKQQFFCLALAMGFCQFSGGIVGWIWSIMYGLEMMKRAK